ncbi:hypothetical protein HELRODRAFT_168658 [Helobdella robusta]|uniref:Uncharacterized protein n=1 Tax=Helobdella robusta TaxID=6412 RepID=T1F0U4_HELRO|nr:hypothetical protein HELRODRAFT_168658 [Helobdella robusta]ESO08758.1 hypothetical protein HELRODRAFT_168658 [Helobdella robusta]
MWAESVGTNSTYFSVECVDSGRVFRKKSWPNLVGKPLEFVINELDEDDEIMADLEISKWKINEAKSNERRIRIIIDDKNITISEPYYDYQFIDEAIKNRLKGEALYIRKYDEVFASMDYYEDKNDYIIFDVDYRDIVGFL